MGEEGHPTNITQPGASVEHWNEEARARMDLKRLMRVQKMI